MRRRPLPAAIVASLALLIAGCSSGADAPPADSSGAMAEAEKARTQAAASLRVLEGTWAGEWRSAPDLVAQGTLRFTWQQFGRAMRGSITISGGQCLDEGPILGRINGSSVNFDIESTEAEVVYRGEVSGETISGTYTTTCNNSGGTWRATKV